MNIKNIMLVLKIRPIGLHENKASRAKGQPGKDVDHKVPLRKGGSKSLSNTRIKSVSSNRSANGHKPGEKQIKRK
jgi:hypothetical protein